MIDQLISAGIIRDDAESLRRIAMTFHAWDEAECGNSDDVKSWGIERDETTGIPYQVIRVHKENKARRYRIPDRERGAEKRLKKIMARYPGFIAYHQPDCRGAALYILRPSDILPDQPIDSYYSRGIAVFK